MTSLDPRRVKQLSDVIDLLVDVLGEPSCPLRRAIVLNDIWQYPGSTLHEVMSRLNLDKSTAFRDIDWLVDHGCVIKKTNADNKREIDLYLFEGTKSKLEQIYRICGGASYLTSILQGFIDLAPTRKQSLREAKILISLTLYGTMDKNDLAKTLYDGPSTTDQRALQNLINEGFVIDYE